MNTISFAKFGNFDNQPGFSADREPDEKTEDFSIILSNIFVALQPPVVPVKAVAPAKTGGDFKSPPELDSKPNFDNSLDDSGSQKLPDAEHTPLFPPILENSSDIPPTLQTFRAENQGIRQRLNGYKTELKPGAPFPPQNNELFRTESKFGGDDSNPQNFEFESDSTGVFLKPKEVDNQSKGFDLRPNELQPILGTFDKYLKSSESQIKVIESGTQTSDSASNFINPELNQSPNSRLAAQIQSETKPKSGFAEIAQNLNTIEKEQPKAEIKSSDAENNYSFKFDKVLETVSKDQKTVETVQNNQSDPAKIAEQINPHLLELAALTAQKNEKQTLKMRLHPAELGTVEIILERNSSGTLNACFQTETEGARQALTKNLDQLRDSLQNAGWQIGRMEITNGSLSSTADGHRENPSRQSESVENYNFSRSSETPDDLEQNNSNRLLSLLA
ncbi:MAG: flagellar hook-length control protein FliK [Actinomycetota bacterium]